MYVPKHFAVDDEQDIRQFVEATRLGALISHGPDGLFATHIPWLVDTHVSIGATLTAHVARANPHWKMIGGGTDALVIFTGANAYITPGWYPSKQDHGKIVPTWNYQAVHLYGHVEALQNSEDIETAIRRLSDKMEHKRETPWSIDDAPRNYIDKMISAIVGLKFTITNVEAKYKLDQNKADQDRLGAAKGLSAEPSDAAQAIAALMGRL